MRVVLFGGGGGVGRTTAAAATAVLRRRVAVGASAGDGAVRVRFRPDPALWPREMAR